MAGCKTVNGISLVCGDLNYPGGADQVFYVGYLSELGTRFSTTQTGNLTAIQFVAYAGLRKFEGAKFSHNFGSEVQVGAGGNISFLQRATIKLITQSTEDDVEVQRLIQSTDAYIVYGNNNDQFFIMGASKGLRGAAGALQSTGQNSGDDVSDTIILEGAEKTKPLRFASASGYTATVALLEGYIR